MVATHVQAAEVSNPFQVVAYGNFKVMDRTGDTGAHADLAELSGLRGTYGVGALEGLRGEVLIWDGRVLVSRGHYRDGRAEPATARDRATLLVTAVVHDWTEIEIPHALNQQAFERFVLERAGQQGIDAGQPFPLIVKGTVIDFQWHAVAGGGELSRPHDQPGHATKAAFSGAATEAVLLGLHSGPALEGVITHPGERFHVHLATPDMQVSGHADAYGVGTGSKLLLPRR
jgi:hypothetical protein